MMMGSLLWRNLVTVLVLILTDVTTGQDTTCYECTNIDAEGNKYAFCPMDGSVDPTKAFKGSCGGKCFTRKDAYTKRLVVRGCTTSMWGMPDPLPDDGCYDWKGETFCVCTNYLCNGRAIGESTNVALDAHIYDPDRPMAEGEILQCFECVNWLDDKYYSQCPKNDSVDPPRTWSGNCTGSCFSKTDPNHPNPGYIARGCTDSQYHMPDPLPPTGCYSYLGATWCICNSSYCNAPAIGESGGTRLDDHLGAVEQNYVESDGIFKCYSCVYMDRDEKTYEQCPKYERVTSNAYRSSCNGSCITRSYDYDERQVGRGCSDMLGRLPNPLPPDGCYSWYTETWCVCSTSRCNGAALGQPMGIEFDAHIQVGGATHAHNSFINVLISLLLFIKIVTS